MKRLLFFFMMIITVISYAQNKRFIYEYRYKLDSTNEEYQREEVVLDINR